MTLLKFQQIINKSLFNKWQKSSYNKIPLITKVNIPDFNLHDFYESLSDSNKILLESSKINKEHIYSIIGIRANNFFFVKDTAKLLCSLMDYDNLNGETINVGTGEEITMKDLLEKVVELMPDYDSKVEYLPPRPADVPRLWVDNSKLKELVNVEQGVNFETGLKETLDFYIKLSKDKNLATEIELYNWEGK